MEELKDKTLICNDCKRKFIFPVKEQKLFGQKGWKDPIRCRYCRRQKKILSLALTDKAKMREEIQFLEVCDKCGRQFYTKFKRKKDEKVYCDDCWAEIKGR